MENPLYQDAMISVTPTRVLSKGFTLYLRNVTSVSIATVRPGRFAPLALAPLVVMYWALNSRFAPFVKFSNTSFLALLPFVALIGTYFFLRVSRLRLQTSGGSVVLASNLTLWEPTDDLKRYERIKKAIEIAIMDQGMPTASAEPKNRLSYRDA